MHETVWHDWHVAHGGRMVDFAGWAMPVQYTSIVEEHHAVRRAAGLFDIAHMGRLRFTGPDAARLVDSLVTNDVTKIPVGQIRYALVTDERGMILDDVLVYRLPDSLLLVVNASNREKILGWIERHRGPFDAQVTDLTFDRPMLALQGPKSEAILNPLVGIELAEMKYYRGTETTVLGIPALVSRTGYTGEDGFEVILPADSAMQVWETIFDEGQVHGLRPAGLGCRDTLRLEAAMPLYGHELSEYIDPFTAGLAFGVKLEGGDFIGRDALIARQQQPGARVRVGLELAGRRIAREGAELYAPAKTASAGEAEAGAGSVPHGGEGPIGVVTSGTFSPTLEKSIAMAYVEPRFAAIGTELEVDIRSKREPARIVELPFYRR